MNQFLPEAIDMETKGIYAFTRNQDERTAGLKRIKGLFSEGVGKVNLPFAKFKAEYVSNFNVMKAILRPHPHSPKDIPDLDVNGNLAEVEKQELFLGIFCERLNDPNAKIEPKSVSSFALEQDVAPSTTLNFYVSEEKCSELLDQYIKTNKNGVPEFQITRNDGTGNYRQFATVTCLPEDKESFRAAIIDSIYIFEDTLKHLAAQRPAASSGPRADGREPG
jgi:hypothetical protein